jgi:hypothetical protein
MKSVSDLTVAVSQTTAEPGAILTPWFATKLPNSKINCSAGNYFLSVCCPHKASLTRLTTIFTKPVNILKIILNFLWFAVCHYF